MPSAPDLSTRKATAWQTGNLRVTQNKTTSIQRDAHPNLFAHNGLEAEKGLRCQDTFVSVESTLVRRARQGCVHPVEERSAFDKAS
jgi:hypothetical protein